MMVSWDRHCIRVRTLGTRRERTCGRVVGNKKSTEQERRNDDVGNGRRRRAGGRDGIGEKSSAREGDRVDEESRGCYYSCGMGGGGASESRRIAPRRVVRLGYQMARTSSRCTVRLYHRARGTSRECNGGIRAVSYAAVAARLRTTLVSPNYLVRLVRSGDRKWTARAENIDRLRPEAPCNEARVRSSERGKERKMRIQSRWHDRTRRTSSWKKKWGDMGVSFVQSQKQWVPIERILHRYVRRRRAHGVLIIVVVRKRGTTVVREISGAQEMLTPSVVHRTPNRVDYYDGANEKQRKREFAGVNEQKKRITHTRGVSISSTEFVRR